MNFCWGFLCVLLLFIFSPVLSHFLSNKNSVRKRESAEFFYDVSSFSCFSRHSLTFSLTQIAGEIERPDFLSDFFSFYSKMKILKNLDANYFFGHFIYFFYKFLIPNLLISGKSKYGQPRSDR